MMFLSVEDTACPDCGGTLGYGYKEEGSGWKAYCDCMECRKEFGSRYISYSDVDSDADRDELAEEHVRRCSA